MALLSADFLAASRGYFEPQRTYNWALEIALDDAGDQQLIIQGLYSFGGVNEASEEIELPYGAEKRYVAGQTTYEESTLVLRDFVNIGIAEAVQRWRYQVKNPETGSQGLAADYKKNADLTLIAPDQSSVRIWKFIGMWPKSFKSGELSMATNDEVRIEVGLRYDKAIPSTGLNTGLGSINVGSLTIPI